MSWILLNAVLAFQVLIVYLVSTDIQRMVVTTRKVREWVMPLPAELLDIREEMTRITKNIDADLSPMYRHFHYIFVTVALSIFTNMLGNDIVWVPFWASIGFTLGSLYHFFVIQSMGIYLNEQTLAAEDEIHNRAWFEDVMEKIQDVAEQNKEENS